MKKRQIPKTIYNILLSMSLLLLISMSYYLYQHYFFKDITVVGEEMAPLLNHGDQVRISLYRDETLQRGQIIAMNAKDGSDDIWVRRIIGIPGDTVKCVDGIVYVNDAAIDESYLDDWFIQQNLDGQGKFTNDFSEVYVYEDYFFCLADNRPISADKDSRAYGYIDESAIIGVDLTLLQENIKLK